MANVDHLLPRVGERVGYYQLVEELARGGMSVVFRAVQLNLNADVAIKLLAPPNVSQVQSQQLLQRFQQEARVAQQLKHPCAIKVRDYGQTQNGLVYLVSDFIDGRVLTNVIAERPLSVERTVRVASQVLGCLNEAHGLGIVHRDLKPDNIMLRDFAAERDVVTVLDFGVAKVQESYDGVVTQVGMTLGTPYYTAPEQCRGEKGLDGRADLYSLGLIIAECLTGRRVVGSDNQMAAVYIHAGAQPLEFEASLHYSPLFPVIQRATQKKKDWRYPDAASMRQALEMAATGQGPHDDVVESTRPIQASAGHRAVGSSWTTPGPAYPTAEHSPPGSDPRAAWTTGSSPFSLPPQASPARVTSLSPPVVRPRRGRLIWLWLSALVFLGVTAALFFILFGRNLSQEQGASASNESRQTAAEQTEPNVGRTPNVEQVPDVERQTSLPLPVDSSRGQGPVTASIQFVDDRDFERRVTLVGCGFASGLRVGERAPLGDTGEELEITRLRDDSHCTARTSAAIEQVDALTEVVFRSPQSESPVGD